MCVFVCVQSGWTKEAKMQLLERVGARAVPRYSNCDLKLSYDVIDTTQRPGPAGITLTYHSKQIEKVWTACCCEAHFVWLNMRR